VFQLIENSSVAWTQSGSVKKKRKNFKKAVDRMANRAYTNEVVSSRGGGHTAETLK